LKDAQLYRKRMSHLRIENGESQNDDEQILTACSDYNTILQGKREATSQEKWKLIFHTDQSLL
jgi:hypothetical protein